MELLHNVKRKTIEPLIPQTGKAGNEMTIEVAGIIKMTTETRSARSCTEKKGNVSQYRTGPTPLRGYPRLKPSNVISVAKWQ